MTMNQLKQQTGNGTFPYLNETNCLPFLSPSDFVFVVSGGAGGDGDCCCCSSTSWSTTKFASLSIFCPAAGGGKVSFSDFFRSFFCCVFGFCYPALGLAIEWFGSIGEDEGSR